MPRGNEDLDARNAEYFVRLMKGPTNSALSIVVIVSGVDCMRVRSLRAVSSGYASAQLARRAVSSRTHTLCLRAFDLLSAE